jgi:glutamate-1-semialdehyde 2,1-aminomutase
MAPMTRNTERSRQIFDSALGYLPGGVNSPVRSFRGVGGDPIVVASGAGSRLRDVDGNDYVDYCGSWGPLILGHAAPEVVAAVQAAAARGLTFGAATEAEATLARMVCEAMPSMQLVRFVNSGTEATMSAIRLARGFTGRSKIVKFDGCYHGHADGLLVHAGSGVATLSLPDSAGVPESYAAETLVAPYNDIQALTEVFDRYADEIAAVIVEPVAANMGVVPPLDGFLEGLRSLCDDNGSLLIFDEVITGFRVGLGGFQEWCGVTPDLTCLGKVVGGGLPVGAYGGRADVMQMIAPLGPVYQAGTLSGNPLTVAAGIATLTALQRPGFYDELNATTTALLDSISNSAMRLDVPDFVINSAGSLFTLFFTDTAPVDYATARRADAQRYARFFHALLERSVYFPPSQYEACFVSAAHTQDDIALTLGAIEEALPLADER